MIKILQKHVTRYPEMQLQDLAKLIYQNEFGGGHLISDSKKSLNRIEDEYHSINVSLPSVSPTVESIGNGMCRIYLDCLDKGMASKVLNEIFVQSANLHQGTVGFLEQKINLCLDACKNRILPFSFEDAKAFFEHWKEQGYPAMSHSDIYRQTYRPAYRVIKESYKKVYDCIKAIEDRQATTIAIDGMCASGKTTLGQLLHMNYPESNLYHMDDYFLQPHQRTSERLAEIGGNVDYERFYKEIILHLHNKEGITYRKYDCQTQTLGLEIHRPWQPLTIVEGSYSHHPYFGNVYDFRIFCNITSAEQEHRILKRNGPKMLKRFINEWIPKENMYFETYKITQKSGLII